MRYREICKILGYFLFCFSVPVTIALGVACYFDFFVLHHEKTTDAFLITLITTLGLAVILRTIGRRATNLFHRKESILVVALMWLIASVISAIPFYATKTFENPLDCWFESVSGLTTTGSTMAYPKAYNDQGEEIPLTYVDNECPTKKYTFYGTIDRVKDKETGKWLTGLDAISTPILFWRGLTQWIGGVGIIFVFIALFPALSIGGKFLFEAESISPSPDTITPRVRETARYLWVIYLGWTILEVVLLMVTNERISFFHALATTFSTVSAGGFSVHNNGITGYNSAATDWIVIFFMIIAATNFTLFFYLIRGKFRRLLDPELYFYIGCLIGAVALVIWKIWDVAPDAFRNAVFQVTSSLTCTGFFTVNYDLWPFAAQAIMLLAMYIGGMTGSSAGGIKAARHLILFRSFRYRIERLFRPNAVQTLRLGHRPISENSLFNTFNFFWTIIFVATFGMFLLILDGIDLGTAISVIACCINNTGLGFRAIGPDGTFAILSPFARTISIIWMLFGRLEFFAFLILLIPSFWKSK